MLSPPKQMTGAEENRHFLRAFIHTYRDLPVLWDTSLRDYTNRDKRAEAYEQLVPIYRYLKRDATVEDVKKKINTLRTNYRKELKVVECARRAGSTHQPRCWTFHELDFLRNTEKFLAVNPNSKSESFTFSEHSQTQSFMDAPSYNFRSMLANTPVQSPPSITEMFQKSFGHTAQKLEPQQTPPPPHADYHQHTQQHQQQHLEPSIKRQRPASPSTMSGTPTTNTQTPPDELLNIACDYLSGTFPEEESIARTWTHKLKRMPREQRLLAEKFVNEILFEGESGTLHRGSVQINTFEPFVRFEEQPGEVKSQSPSVHTSTATPTLAPTQSNETNDEASLQPSDNASRNENNFPNYN